MVDIQTISIAIASASVVVGVIYYAFQIRHQAKMRQTDFIVRLYSTYGSKEFHDILMEVHALQFNDYEDFVKKYGPWFSKPGSAQTAIFVVSTYFQQIGALLSRKIIDINFLYDVWGSTSIKLNWEKVKPIVLGLRQQFNLSLIHI